MTQCIYCHKKSTERFRSVEHVIPQAFGTFGSKTPTLQCVCDACNDYFSKELDVVLARDTIEGITRYTKGKTSSSRQFPKSVRFALEEGEETGEFGGALLGGRDPQTGELLPPRPQFWIRNVQNKEWERYPIEEIKTLSITDEKYGPSTPGSREMRIIAPSQQDHDAVIQELKRCGIPYREKEQLGLPPFVKKVGADGKITVPGTIKGTIGKVHKRALAKVLFNFAAYYLGPDETSKSEWDKARRFIRDNGETLLARLSQKEFWTGQEKSNLRFADDSYNLRIENQNGHVVGVIQLYNLFTYEFILAENHSIPEDKETARRFTPGQEPHLGVKMERPREV